MQGRRPTLIGVDPGVEEQIVALLRAHGYFGPVYRYRDIGDGIIEVATDSEDLSYFVVTSDGVRCLPEEEVNLE